MLYLKEGKIRILYILLSFIFTWINTWIFSNQFIYLITLPLKEAFLKNNPNTKFHLIFTELTEVFYAQLKISLLLGWLLFYPLIFYQIWLFIKPGLYRYEKKKYRIMFWLSFILTYLSILFTYYIILPLICKFFLNFENVNGFNIYLEAKMDKYLSFIFNFFILSFFLFQLPLLFILLFNLGLLNLNTLIKKRKLAYLFSWLLSILIAPPDFLSQLSFILPYFFFYELSLFYLILINKYSSFIKFNQFNEFKA